MKNEKSVYDDRKDWVHGYMMADDDARFRHDIDYMKSMYPPVCREIQIYVDEVCDRREYEGSPMFDEYPDRVRIDGMVDEAYEMASYLENMYQPVLEESDRIQTQGHCVSCRGKDSWVRDMIVPDDRFLKFIVGADGTINGKRLCIPDEIWHSANLH